MRAQRARGVPEDVDAELRKGPEGSSICFVYVCKKPADNEAPE